jgi:L-alanine-DL-glutamate epimerase-like enolase superfamily enzyme
VDEERDTYRRVAELPLAIEGYELAGLSRDVSSTFTRRTTIVRLRGAGEVGTGEDVTYTAAEQEALQTAGPTLPLAGEYTVDSFSRLLEELSLYASEPAMPASRLYRRWAFESAALDLALRQARMPLAEAVGRLPRPVHFVVSTRLGEPASFAPLRAWLDLYPSLHFKLDATSSWDDALVEQLVETGAVDTIDLKGAYHGTVVDQPPDAALYARVLEAFAHAWIEDPALTPETEPLLVQSRDRVTWDAVIHSVSDIEALPFPPRMLNIKPSRFGSVRSLFAAYDYCDARGIGMYGGGQFELGAGRVQIEHLASLFHPETPNDVAPGAYNDAVPQPGLPESPLRPPAPEPGLATAT